MLRSESTNDKIICVSSLSICVWHVVVMFACDHPNSVKGIGMARFYPSLCVCILIRVWEVCVCVFYIWLFLSCCSFQVLGLEVALPVGPFFVVVILFQ